MSVQDVVPKPTKPPPPLPCTDDNQLNDLTQTFALLTLLGIIIFSAITVSLCTIAFTVALLALRTERDVCQPLSFRFFSDGQVGSVAASSVQLQCWL